MRRTWCSSTLGSLNASRSARSSSSTSGRLLQRKNDKRDASAGSSTGYALPEAASTGSSSIRNRNDGLTRSRASACSMPRSKPPFAAARFVEGQQHAQVVRIDRAAERPSRQCRQDLLGALALGRGPRRGPAGEDAVPARRAGRGAGTVRPGDDDLADVRQAVRPVVLQQRAQERTAHALDLRGWSSEEGDGQPPRPRLHRNPDAQIGVGRLQRARAPVGIFGSEIRSDGQQSGPRAIDGNLHLVRLVQPHDVAAVAGGAVAGQADPDLVLAVDREEVVDQRAPPRAERQPVQAIALGQLGRHAVDVGGHRHARVAGDREPADPVRGSEVALEQERREAEDVADVVESVAGRIRRQHRRHVDIEGQQVAHRVPVLGAVQAVQDGRPARVGACVRRGVEPRLQPRRDPVVGLRVRPRPARRRHGAVAEPPDDVLPALGITGDLAGVEHVESEPGLAPDRRAPIVARLAVAAQDGLHLRAAAGFAGRDGEVLGLREAVPRRRRPHAGDQQPDHEEKPRSQEPAAESALHYPLSRLRPASIPVRQLSPGSALRLPSGSAAPRCCRRSSRSARPSCRAASGTGSSAASRPRSAGGGCP